MALAGEGWTLTGTLMSSGSQSASWCYGLDLDLDAQETWEATNGSGGSSGLGEMHTSFTGSGNYSYALGNGTISGSFSLTSSEHVAPYMFSTSAAYADGQWSETGTASATATGQGNSSYTGTGTVGMAGQQWNASITVSENGTDGYLYLYGLGYVLDEQGDWTLDTASGGMGGNGLANWCYSADGSYWYDVGLSTVTGTFSEFAEDQMSYGYTTTDTAAGGVWVYSGFGTWNDHGHGNRSLSAESPYTTADGYSGTVHETGYESFSYNYTGGPALSAQGDWYWSTGTGQASGNGHWTFNRSGSKSYSRSDGETYSVSGTKSENITDRLSYSYSTLAAVNGQAVWVVNGGATAQASGQATWTYSANGSFSSSSCSAGYTSTYNATTSERGSSGSGYNFSLEFELVDELWVPTTGQGRVTATREEHFSHSGSRETSEQGSWSSSGGSSQWNQSRTVSQGQTKDLTYERTDRYVWVPSSASGSGSASGSASSPWRLTKIEESGSGSASRRLDYGYSGRGSWEGQWGDASEGGSGSGAWDAVRSIRQRSNSAETLRRTITWSASGEATSSGSNVRSAWASGQAYSFYDSAWEDHWWLEPETWGSGGTYENATYDEYNYEYQWRKTWVPEGEPEVTESATNGVLGLENGAGTGWWSWCSAGGSSSSTSWSGSWSSSYGTTVEYPGFFDGAYYGVDNGGVREEYFEYLGDAFSDNAGSDTRFFPYAYSGEELLFGQAQRFAAALLYLQGYGRTHLSPMEPIRQEASGHQRAITTHQTQPERLATLADGEDPRTYTPRSPVGQATVDNSPKDTWDNPNWRLGAWGSFFGTVYAGIAGTGRVLTFPGRLIPGTRDFWERRDRALQRLYDASNIGGTGWQTLSEFGSEAAAFAITWGIATPSVGAAGAVGPTGEAALARVAAALRFTETTATHMANPARYVPRHILAAAILRGERMPDPQGAVGAVKIVCTIYRNGKQYVLEIIYRESDNTILHFLYR